MASNDFGISLSENSINEIKSLIENYSSDIIGILNGFQDDLIEHVTSANYDKLLTAINGIIQMYDESVRTELKQSVFSKWEEACETMRSFAEQMQMGEESELAASEIEAALFHIFDTVIENRLNEVSVDGRTSASAADFDAVIDIFKSVVDKVRNLSEDIQRETERLGNDNEFYKFILPVVIAYSEGLCGYFDSASKSLEDLKGSYLEKMASARDAVQKTQPNDDLSFLLDFSDLGHVGMGMVGVGSSYPAPVSAEQKRAANGTVKTAQSAEDEMNEKIKKLINALTALDGTKCRYLSKNVEKYLSDLYNKYDYDLKKRYNELDLELREFWAFRIRKIAEKREDLSKQYSYGQITRWERHKLLIEYAEKTYQKWKDKYDESWKIYNNWRQRFHQRYNEKVKKYSTESVKAEQYRMDACRQLCGDKKALIQALRGGWREETLTKIRKQIQQANTCCEGGCIQVEDIQRCLYRICNSPDLNFKNTELAKFKEKETEMTWREDLRATNPKFKESCKKRDQLLNATDPELKKSLANEIGAYTQNCQRCVVAYEVRRRGFDVTAAERLFDGSDKLPYMDDPEGFPSVFEDENGGTPTPERVTGKTMADAIENIKKKMAWYGDGARAIILIGRILKDGSKVSGHVFIAEQIDGETIFCDPQSARENAIENFGDDNGKTGNRRIYVCDSSPRCEISKGKEVSLADCSRCKRQDVHKNKEVRTSVKIPPSSIRIMRIDNLKITSRVSACCRD